MDFDIIEPVIDPANKMGFLLDWEVTMKCNLDCSYCAVGINGGHDNSTAHPPLDQCLRSIDFMFEYVDLYMQHKPKGIRSVVLNVYGGESLHHPHIVEILTNVKDKYKKYQDRWHLTVTTTTNALVTEKKILAIIPMIDEFTVSYHAESNSKQKAQFKDNLLRISRSQCRLKCIVPMHADLDLFEDCKLMIDWLTKNNIKYLPKQLDLKPLVERVDKTKFNYDHAQVTWFENFYVKKSYNIDFKVITDQSADTNTNRDLSDTGRACCGGRQLCKNSNYKTRHFYVENKFTDWYCSVNEFFLFVKQVNGTVYVNKDCKMNFDGSVGPIGSLDHADSILSTLKTQLTSGDRPIIKCKKYNCLCGLCAPKAKNLARYQSIIKKYRA
jgi:pyruvate-formate lyase-activating enzyme